MPFLKLEQHQQYTWYHDIYDAYVEKQIQNSRWKSTITVFAWPFYPYKLALVLQMSCEDFTKWENKNTFP